ncbi:helix-turn-helix domain-containing protein [Bacteroides heparinolyticus]|uniref:helix-turn-helix domain-containing protein n=1 Tax=Prevotella heparinolytica TaxID=28113 RepID=UPI00359F3225
MICLLCTILKGGEDIKIKDAIVERFRQLCAKRNISYTELARLAGVTPSTVYSMLQPERRDISAVTVKKLSDGLGMSIIDFYDCDLFRNLPPEID